MIKTLIYLILLFGTTLAQKYEMTGFIHDKETGHPLSYASIRIDGTTNGTATNYDGQFILRLNEGNYKLIFSYVGYKTDTLAIRIPVNKQLNVNLQPEAVRLEEVVVSANEDPAYRIIREAIRRKKENTKGLVNFEYNAYSKRIMKSAGELAIIEETFVKGYHKINNWEKEFILSTHKTENQKKQVHSMELNISDSYYINFSKDTLTLMLNKIYLPIADNAFDYYDYKLLSITESATGDVYTIKVIPRSRIQPLLQGEITIESNTYSMNSINLEISEGVRFPFINDLSVKFVQQLGKYSGYWLPNYIETKAGFELSFQGLLALDRIEFEEASSITEYKINASIPDSIEQSVRSKYGGYTADTSDNVQKPYELSRDEINEQRPIPLTQKEVEAYATLDSTKTIEKIIKVKGALSGLIQVSGEKDTTKGIFSTVSGFLTEYLTFDNNRVTGIHLGPRYNGYLIKNKLSMNISSGYAFQRKKVEGELKLNFEMKDFFINNIEVQIFNKSRSWQMFTPYSDFMNGVAVTFGFNDQFNYYLSSGFSVGLTKNLGKKFSTKIDFVSEKENSLPEMKYQSLIKTNRAPRENPKIVEGTDRKVSLKLRLGKDPTEIQILPGDGLIAQFDLSNPMLSSSFNYKRFRAAGVINTKTFYKELFSAPYLEMRADVGIVFGNYATQHLFSPNTALGFFSPPGAFKGLNPYQQSGTEMVSLHLEHNWRTVPFQALGLNFISDLYLDFITGVSVLRTWNRSNYLPGILMQKPYWEAYAGISRILGIIRIDVSYNSLKKISVTSAIGVVL